MDTVIMQRQNTYRETYNLLRYKCFNPMDNISGVARGQVWAWVPGCRLWGALIHFIQPFKNAVLRVNLDLNILVSGDSAPRPPRCYSRLLI